MAGVNLSVLGHCIDEGFHLAGAGGGNWSIVASHLHQLDCLTSRPCQARNKRKSPGIQANSDGKFLRQGEHRDPEIFTCMDSDGLHRHSQWHLP
jgi:hypothetical protein